MVFSHLYSSALDRELGTDDSTRLFTTGRRQNAINEGLLEFADRTECCIRTDNLSCSNGVTEYALVTGLTNGATFLRLHGQQPEFVKMSSGSSASTTYQAGATFRLRSINYLNLEQPGWRTSTGGTPEAFYLRTGAGGQVFGLVPPPRIGSSETGRVSVSYIFKPTVLTSDTHVPFMAGSTVSDPRSELEPYHQAIVHYAAGQLEKLRKDWQAVAVQQQLFQAYVERYKQASRVHGPRQVLPARNYFSEARRSRDGAGWPSWWVSR